MRIKRRNGLVSALLGLVTCGLYHIFFWYQYGEDTNWVCRDDRKMTQNYILAWILSWITCGIYGLYWTYQLASRLDQAGDRYNVHIESPVIFTIVMHIPFLSYFYACDVMNNFADAYEKTAPQQTERLRDCAFVSPDASSFPGMRMASVLCKRLTSMRFRVSGTDKVRISQRQERTRKSVVPL